MNDEELIIKYLEQNYYLATNNNGFIIAEKFNDKLIPIPEMVSILILIFTDNESTIKTFNNWLGQNQSIILNDLNDGLFIIEKTKGGLYLENEMVKNFKNLDNYFVCNFAYQWYVYNIINPKLKEILSELILKLGPRNWEVHKPNKGIYTLNQIKLDYFHADTPRQFIYIAQEYEKWYENQVILASEATMNIKYL